MHQAANSLSVDSHEDNYQSPMQAKMQDMIAASQHRLLLSPVVPLCALGALRSIYLRSALGLSGQRRGKNESVSLLA